MALRESCDRAGNHGGDAGRWSGVRYPELADGEFNHTSALVLLDRDGRVVTRTGQVGSQVDPEFLAAVRDELAAPSP